MNRVYRLLRNNLEYGPFTIDELLGQQLRPTDMLWIEGHSTAWCYLSEIELKPSEKEIKSSPSIPVGRIKARSSSDELEKRAEEIRKNVLAYQPPVMPVIEEIVDKDERHYYIPTADNETIELVDHRKQKSTMMADIMMTGVIVVLFAGGLYGGRTLFQSGNWSRPAEAASTADSDAAYQAKVVADTPTQQTMPVQADTVNVSLKDSVAAWSLTNARPAVLRKQDTSQLAALPPDTTADKPATPGITASQTALEPQPEETEKLKPKKDIESSPKKTEEKREEKNDTTDEDASGEKKEKKDGFFKKLFGKKKKNQRDSGE